MGEVDRLGDGAADERLRCRHHPDVAVDGEIALTLAPARRGAVEDRQVLRAKPRRAFESHRAADMGVGGLDLVASEAQRGEQAERDVFEAIGVDAECVDAEAFAQGPLVEDESNVEGVLEPAFDPIDGFVGKSFGAQGVMSQRRCADQRAVAGGVADDPVDGVARVAEAGERHRDHPVDDFEIAAAGQLLELHQREIGLDSGRVAVHHQADGAGRRDDRGLRIAIAMALAQSKRLIPRSLRRGGKCCDLRVRRPAKAPAEPTAPRSLHARRGRRGGGCARPAALPRGCARNRKTAPSSAAIAAEVA